MRSPSGVYGRLAVPAVRSSRARNAAPAVDIAGRDRRDEDVEIFEDDDEGWISRTTTVAARFFFRRYYGSDSTNAVGVYFSRLVLIFPPARVFLGCHALPCLALPQLDLGTRHGTHHGRTKVPTESHVST